MANLPAFQAIIFYRPYDGNYADMRYDSIGFFEANHVMEI